MGANTSKKSADTTERCQILDGVDSVSPEEPFQQLSNLSPLQNAVLYKRYTEATQLLAQSSDVNEVGEFGLTLLHLAVVPKPPKAFMLDRYYDHLSEDNMLTLTVSKPVRQMVELLCSCGAILKEDSFKMNPLEAIHYCSCDTCMSSGITHTLTSCVSLTATDLIRFSLWRLINYRCWKLYSLNPNLKSIAVFNLERKKAMFHSVLPCIKHGMDPDNVLGIFTPLNSVESLISFGFNCVYKKPGWNNNDTDRYFYAATFGSLELMLTTWKHLWNMSDPLDFTFHSSLVGLLLYFPVDTDIGMRSRELFEILITSWVKIPSYKYPKLTGEVMTITRYLMGYLSSVWQGGKKIDLKKIVSLSKLNQLLYMLADIISLMKKNSEISEGVIMGQLVGFNLHKLLIKKYGVHVPYVETEMLSKSLSNLMTLSSIAHSYLDQMTDFKRFDPKLDKRECMGFFARVDPNLNVRRLNSGRTPLHDALLFGDIFLVQTLIENGANPFTVDKEGNSFIEQLSKIINSFNIGPAKQLYEDTRDKYIILRPPFPLLTLAANVITREKIPFDILSCQPRLYNMLLSYLPPTA